MVSSSSYPAVFKMCLDSRHLPGPEKSPKVVQKPHEVLFKPLPLHPNGVLSPVEEGKTESSPMTHAPQFPMEGLPSRTSTTLGLSQTPPPPLVTPYFNPDDHGGPSPSSGDQGKQLYEEGTDLRNNRERQGLNFDVSYRLLSLSVHGGGIVFPPGFDYTLLNNQQDNEDESPIDLEKLKDSISTTLTSGKNVLLQNWRDLETRFKQMGVSDKPSSRSSSPLENNHELSFGLDALPESGGLDNHPAEVLVSQVGTVLWEDLPLVNAHSLVTSTGETQRALRNPDILLNTQKREELLLKWVDILNQVQEEILQQTHEEYLKRDICDNQVQENPLEVNGNSIASLDLSSHLGNDSPQHNLSLRLCPVVVHSPFCLTPEVHLQVANLAASCMRMRIFGTRFQRLLKFFPLDDLWEDQLCHTGQDRNGNETRRDLSTDDDLLALFVRNYFHLLCSNRDSWESLLSSSVQLDNSLEGKDSRFKTWSAFIKGVQLLKQNDPFDLSIQNGNLQNCTLDLMQTYRVTAITVANVVKLARLDYKRTLEVCLKLCSQMSPVDLLYVSQCTSHHPDLFLSCFHFILRDFPLKQKNLSIAQVFSSVELTREWISSALSFPPVKENATVLLKCMFCGSPMPGSHLYTWPHGHDLLQVLDALASARNQHEYLFESCYRQGFWPGYLLLLQRCKRKPTHLETLLLLDDGRLLSEEHPLGCLPDTIDQWKSLLFKLSMRHDLAKSQALKMDHQLCLGCSKEGATLNANNLLEEHRINLDLITRRMLCVYRPAQVLELLGTLKASPGVLSSTTFRAAILTHLIDAQQNMLSHSILARLESYLWSKRSTATPPQIWRVFEEEKKSTSDVPVSKKSPDSLPLRNRCLRYLEEPENHWGITTQILRSCPLCGIPLSSQLSANQSSKIAGVTVGSCGHAFHSSCVGQQTAPCPICIDRPKISSS